MNFVVDQQLPQSLAAWLTTRGHSAEHVRNIGLRDADDSMIWRHAIVWLRSGNTTTHALLAWLEQKWPAVEAAIAVGDAIVEVR